MDLGYVFSCDYERKGYVSETSTRIFQYWKDEFSVKETCIVTTEDNIASRKVAEANGLVDGGYVMKGDTKMVAYMLPGMKKLEGQNFPIWGDGEIPEEYH